MYEGEEGFVLPSRYGWLEGCTRLTVVSEKGIDCIKDSYKELKGCQPLESFYDAAKVGTQVSVTEKRKACKAKYETLEAVAAWPEACKVFQEQLADMPKGGIFKMVWKCSAFATHKVDDQELCALCDFGESSSVGEVLAGSADRGSTKKSGGVTRAVATLRRASNACARYNSVTVPAQALGEVLQKNNGRGGACNFR